MLFLLQGGRDNALPSESAFAGSYDPVALGVEMQYLLRQSGSHVDRHQLEHSPCYPCLDSGSINVLTLIASSGFAASSSTNSVESIRKHVDFGCHIEP